MLADRDKLQRRRGMIFDNYPRHPRRAFRPRVDALEGRALMALFPGNPFTLPAPTQFSGGGSQTAAQPSLAAFQQAIGGADNTTSPTPQAGGFRTINWDGVNLTGTDFGGGANTTVISPGEIVGIPSNRFQSRGVFFDEVNAVSGNGFDDASPDITPTTFPAFSPNNTFSPINDNTLEMSFVLASAATTTPVPAATRGFGAIFIGSQGASTSSIEYFSGDRLLFTLDVPVGVASQPQFVGALFTQSVVTRVRLTVGEGAVLVYDGTNIDPSGVLPPNQLAVLDDFDYAEPVPLGSVPPVLPGPQGTVGATSTITAAAGAAFTGTVATFSDTVPNTTASAYTAVINWGDGKTSNGTVTRNAQGGFDVSGTTTFARAGRIPVSVRVQKFAVETPTDPTSIDLTNVAEVASAATTTTLAAAPTSAIAGQPITFTATVAIPQGSTPRGNVTFLDGTTPIGIVPIAADGTAVFTTSTLRRGSHPITAVYNGDESLNASTSAAPTVDVRSDVTNQVTATVGRARFRRGRFQVRVDLVNNGPALPGPIILVLDNFNTRSELINASGFTRDQLPADRPFIIVTNSGLAQGATASVNLVLRGRNARAIRFNPQILAGNADT